MVSVQFTIGQFQKAYPNSSIFFTYLFFQFIKYYKNFKYIYQII